MQFQFSFKHMERSEALQKYVEQKVIGKIERFVTKAVSAKFSFEVIHDTHHVHCSVTGGDGFSTDIDVQGADMYAAVDELVDRLSKQLRKHKEILKEHKGHDNVRTIVTSEAKRAAAGGKNGARGRGDGPEMVDAEDILKYEAALKRRAVGGR